ncbi:phosphatase PAP2 family protein [Thermococcus sp.]|uniref:phosphatase PAP2 family protein n=1 Tax=Thermococcus sp. TaxID=35749 RepID=UPI0025DCE3FE|nr:phosphatase PAP2 family protein [Thermococcus sp.]
MRGKRLKLLLAFLVVYLSWDAYALIYPLIGRWSVNVLSYFLKLPLTSYRFEYSVVSWTVSNEPVHRVMRAVYKAGFVGSFWLPAIYFTLTDEKRAKRLFRRFALGFGLLALSFALFHVYAPHVVYTLPEHYAPNDWTARPEFVFPSPHCTLAFIGLLSVLEERKRETLLLALFLALVPVSTVLLGEHWVWDVLAGFMVALLAVRLEKRV